MKKIISANDAPQAIGPYSQATQANGFLFISGQLGVTPQGEFAGTDVDSQAKRSLQNLEAILTEVGLGFESVVKTTIFLADMDDYAGMNAAWDAWVDTQNTPARACVEAKLAKPEWRVEIKVSALVK